MSLHTYKMEKKMKKGETEKKEAEREKKKKAGARQTGKRERKKRASSRRRSRRLPAATDQSGRPPLFSQGGARAFGHEERRHRMARPARTHSNSSPQNHTKKRQRVEKWFRVYIMFGGREEVNERSVDRRLEHNKKGGRARRRVRIRTQ